VLVVRKEGGEGKMRYSELGMPEYHNDIRADFQIHFLYGHFNEI